ncbi:dTDP-glucose 4,6-dehydratase [bacterium]|nr:dTDP-glucose 4,6-dehydratase [bacterium]
MDPKNILVTGGCGFIGSHFIEHTLQAYPDAQVTNVDAMTYAAHPDTAAYLAELAPERYRFIRADIASADMAAILTPGSFDAVVNFAAETHVDRSILDPAAFVRTNVLGAQNLADLCRFAQVGRFVHVSTDEVYGTLEPDAPLSCENARLDPNSPYAASKAAADLLVLASARTFGQDALITRCTNNYGSYQFPEKLLPLVIANSIDGLPIPVYGDGKQVRDWIYAADHALGIDLALRRGRTGEIYNFSAREQKENLTVIRQVLKMLDKPESLITFVGDRPAHDRRYALDPSKAEKELGWKPQVSFEEGLTRTVDWYLSNQGWWRKVRDKKYFDYYRANYDVKFAETEGPTA